jgi:cyclase
MDPSDHFVLEELAEGVWAALAAEDGGAGSNAGLVDLGDRTLVFDAFESHLAAADLQKASQALTGRVPGIVILSHFHFDHWAGLQVFAELPILATHATRQSMQAEVEEVLEFKRDLGTLEAETRETEKRMQAETDPVQRRALQSSAARMRWTLKALPALEPTLPNITFAGKTVFHGTRHSVELIPMGRGHTESDCLLYLPEERIVFAGDLGFFQQQPFMSDCFPQEWLARIAELCAWEVETLVPGHGPLGGKEDLELDAGYIRALEDLARQAIKDGLPLEEAQRMSLPEPFDAWQRVGRRFQTNMWAAYRRQGQTP